MICVCVCGGGGGGYLSQVRKMPNIWTSVKIAYVGSGHFLGVQNFECQYFLGFQKNEHFWG